MTEKIKKLVENSKSIAIFFHIGPDGDAVGSALALKYGLEQFGKEVTVFSQDEIRRDFWFLEMGCIKNEIVSNKFDLGFVLDCSEIKRIGTMEAVFKNCKNIINIDHHLNNENFTDYKIVDENASSTCEIMFEFLKELNISFTKQIKISLYTGLSTDSGCFMFNINKKLHLIANALVEGIEDEIEKINYMLFREKSFNELKLTAEAINRLESFFDDKFAFTILTQRDLKKLDIPIDYTPNIIFLLSGLKNYDVICVACEESQGVFRVSFRSSKTDVCLLARMFGGGGHKFASGCKVYGNKNLVRKKILDKAEEYFNARNS